VTTESNFSDRAKHYCSEPNCPVLLSYGEGPRCPAHRREHDRNRTVDKPVKRLFGLADWKRTRARMLTLNGICQRVIDGVRCSKPVAEVHHLIGAEQSVARGVFYDWHFLAGVCESHNPSSFEDDWGVYVPTLWMDFMAVQPIPEALCLPGARLSDEQMRQLWSLPERLEFLRRSRS
jgi:hypothetical protein